MKTFLRRIGDHLWAYITYPLVVVVLSGLLFSYLSQVKTEEKLVVFFSSYSKKIEDESYYQKKKPDYIKKLEIHAYSVENSSFIPLVESYGLGISDILVLPDQILSTAALERDLAPIRSSYRSVFPSLGFHELGGLTYGIKVYDHATNQSLLNGLSFQDKDFYLYFRKASIHIGDVSSIVEKKPYDGAISFVQEILQ